MGLSAITDAASNPGLGLSPVNHSFVAVVVVTSGHSLKF